MQLALAKHQAGQYPNLSQAAAAHGVARSTLSDRSRGRRSKKDAYTNLQTLPPAAETALVEHIRHSSANGFPLNAADVRSLANSLARGVPGCSKPPEVGKEWLRGFLLRHPSIRSCWSRCLENARVRSADPEAIRQWYNRLQEIIHEYQISSENIFNMDETGFMFGQGASQRVLVPDNSAQTSRFKAQPGNRESATAIECIGSGGQVLPPLIITRGKVHTVGEQRRMVDIPATWHFSKGPTGYNDAELACLWVEDIFDAHTTPSSQSAWRLLVLDGHKIHTTSWFLDALWQRRIVPLCMPPHCTHVMQPLDVSIFGPLTAAYRRLVVDIAPQVSAGGIDKPQFGSFYAEARAKTLTSAAAKKAFQDTGITVNPSPVKVLERLGEASAADDRCGAPQSAEQEDAAIPHTEAAFSAALEAFRNAKDEREARGHKKTLLEAFSWTQAELAAVQAENVVLHAQEDRNQRLARKKVPRKTAGDGIYLSRERMISREEAERGLIAKQPEIQRAKEKERRREERQAAADDDDDDNDDDEEVLLSVAASTTIPSTFLDSLDDDEPLSNDGDNAAAETTFWGTVPCASTSRTQL